MIALSDVSAVIPTRGDVDVLEVVESLAECAEVIIWDNSVEAYDARVFGRYEAIARASMKVIYTQDDDCITNAKSLCHYYEPDLLTVNMPVSRWDDYPDSALVGWGAIFDRELPAQAFKRFDDYDFGERPHEWPTGFFARTCDVVFSTLTPTIKLDLGFRHLPWAETAGRMFKTPGHKEERDAMLALAREVKRR